MSCFVLFCFVSLFPRTNISSLVQLTYFFRLFLHSFIPSHIRTRIHLQIHCFTFISTEPNLLSSVLFYSMFCSALFYLSSLTYHISSTHSEWRHPRRPPPRPGGGGVVLPDPRRLWLTKVTLRCRSHRRGNRR